MELIGVIIGYLLGCAVSYWIFIICENYINKGSEDPIYLPIRDRIYFSAFSWIGAVVLFSFLISQCSRK